MFKKIKDNIVSISIALVATCIAIIILWFTYGLISPVFQYVAFEVVLFAVQFLGLWIVGFKYFPKLKAIQIDEKMLYLNSVIEINMH